MLYLFREKTNSRISAIVTLMCVGATILLMCNYVKAQNCFSDTSEINRDKVLAVFFHSRFKIFRDISHIDEEFKNCYKAMYDADFIMSNPGELYNYTDQDVGLPYRQLIFYGKGRDSVNFIFYKESLWTSLDILQHKGQTIQTMLHLEIGHRPSTLSGLRRYVRSEASNLSPVPHGPQFVYKDIPPFKHN